MPTDELEHELRRALAAAAVGYPDPDQARQRLARRNYRPGSGHRRLAAGITTAAAAASVALGLVLSGAVGPAPARGTGTIRTAAFTLMRNANGTDTLTISPHVIGEPGTLQGDLAQYGIPAVVNAGSFCSSSPAPDGFSQVVTFSPPLNGNVGYQQIQNPTITIDPSAMPSGTKLSFGIFQPSASPRPIVAIALIDASSSTCASTTPATVPPGGALLHVPAGS